MTSPAKSTPKWQSQKKGFQEALEYIDGRRKGLIKSFKTPWSKFNDATTDGIEWGTTTIIAGRPGAGKTLIKDQIIREGFKLNKGEDFRVLEFSLEMSGRTTAIRQFSAHMSMSYKQLCSADGKVSDPVMHACYEYAKERVKYPIDVVEEPCTVTQFRSIIIDYMEAHKAQSVDKKYKNTIITLDHSLLLEKEAYQDDSDMLYKLGKTLTELKKRFPIAFIILSQLNRNIDNPDRNEDGKYGNYILESDVFGADALLQHADTLIGVNRPGKQKIQYYGPDRYFIENDNVLVFHFLKCRNGDVRMSFFNAEYHKMCVSELPTPPMQERRLKI